MLLWSLLPTWHCLQCLVERNFGLIYTDNFPQAEQSSEQEMGDHKSMALKWWENVYRLANAISQWNITGWSWSTKHTLEFFQPGTWFLHLWQMAPPALDITFVPLLSLDSEVRLPSIEASTLSPEKFSFPPKYWPVVVLLCLWDLTRLEASLACLQARSPCK